MLDHRLQKVGCFVNHMWLECKQMHFMIQIMTWFLLKVLMSSCFMFDFKSLHCYDVAAVVQLQIQLELNILCSNQNLHEV